MLAAFRHGASPYARCAPAYQGSTRRDWAILLTSEGSGVELGLEEKETRNPHSHQSSPKAMSKKKMVLVVDDSRKIRDVVRLLFDSHPDFEVCGEAEHGREAVEKALRLKPDLIILDLSMPVMSGLEAAPLLVKILPRVWLILLTSHSLPELERLSQAAGIHAIVPKHKAATHLIAQAEELVLKSLERTIAPVPSQRYS
jgi:CheY-like chemotaxis protein